MRIKHPQAGDTREREGFLWRPRYGEWMTRWLEHAHWIEVWSGYGHQMCWSFVSWLDLERGE